MSVKLNDLLKEAIVCCETSKDIAFLRKVLNSTVLEVPDRYFFKYVERTVIEVVKLLELPDEDRPLGGRLLKCLRLLQEEILDYCKSYFEASLKTHLKEIHSALLDPQSYGPTLLAKIIILCGSKVCVGTSDLRETLEETLKLLSPLSKGIKDSYITDDMINILPKEKVFSVLAVQELFLNYQSAFLATLEENPKMYEKTVIGFNQLIVELSSYYEETLTIN